MSLQPDSKKQNWVIVTAISFVVFLLLAILLIIYGKNLQLSVPVYFFLLCAMALADTGLLAGALKSQAKYSGKIIWSHTKSWRAGSGICNDHIAGVQVSPGTRYNRGSKYFS